MRSFPWFPAGGGVEKLAGSISGGSMAFEEPLQTKVELVEKLRWSIFGRSMIFETPLQTKEGSMCEAGQRV